MFWSLQVILDSQSSASSAMTTTVSPDSSEKEELSLPLEKKFPILQENPWLEYALQQSQILQNTILHTTDSAMRTARSRLSEIRDTSSAHFHQTLVRNIRKDTISSSLFFHEIQCIESQNPHCSVQESLETIKDQFGTYENLFFGKIKG